MKTGFRHFIQEHKLIEPGQQILLAVSGGIDSMVMLHLFRSCGYRFAVAHCNFQLRDADSEGDEQLVVETCRSLGIKCYTKSFDTVGYAKQNKITIQEAAREIRYTWFEQLRQEFGYASVAIAHNKNDVAETMLINLSRGTGLKGLTGIRSCTNGVIRPLLFALRTDIEKYANAENVAFREDRTNAEVHYARNRIRHRVLPQLTEVNPAVIHNFYHTSVLLNRTWEAIEKMNYERKNTILKLANDELHFSISALTDYPFYHLFLLEELKGYGFSPSTVQDICQSLQGQAGKEFYSHSHRLVRDREYLMLSRIDLSSMQETIISSPEDKIQAPIALSFKVVEAKEIKTFPGDKSVAYFDMDAVEFPLTLRPWQQGDQFVPFGMTGHKKLSDFLTDEKLPLHHKNKALVLLSGSEIIWVVGHRPDNRFRVTPKTKRVLVVTAEHCE